MKRFVPQILLVLLCVLSLSPFVLGGKAIYFGNIADLYVPFRAYSALSLREWQFPLWTPFLYSGYPFLADPQSSVFYPTTLLFMVLDPVRAIVWETVLSLSVAALGMYLLLRLLRCTAVPAFLGAGVFACSGFFTAHIQHTPLLSAAVWLPLLLSCSLLAWERRNLLYAVVGGIILSLVFFAGHPQYAYYFALLVILECFVRCFMGMRGRTSEVEASPRGGASGVEEVKPRWGGRFDLNASREGFKSCLRAVAPALTILLIAAGLAAIQILQTAEFALLSERQEGLGPAEVRLFGWTFAHFLRLLFPYAFLPPGDADFWWRTDLGETTGYVGIAALLLALIGVWKGERRTRRLGLSYLLAGTLLALSPTLPFMDILSELIPGFSFFRVPGRFILFQTFGFAMLLASGAEVVEKLPMSRLAKNVSLMVVTAFLFADLIVFRLGFIPPVTPPPALGASFPSPSSHITGVSRLLTQKVASNFALLQGIENVSGYTPLTVRRYTQVLSPLLGGNIPDSPMLQFLNIDMALAPEEFPRYGTEEIRGTFSVRNPNVLPRATVVHRFLRAAELPIPVTEYLHSQDFDPQEEALLEDYPSPLPEEPRDADPPDRVRLASHRSREVMVEAELSRPGLLVLSEVHYPGWEVRVNGEVKPILRANEAFRAVALPAGKQRVEFSYNPLSFRVGRAISIATLIVLVGIFLSSFVFHLRKVQLDPSTTLGVSRR